MVSSVASATAAAGVTSPAGPVGPVGPVAPAAPVAPFLFAKRQKQKHGFIPFGNETVFLYAIMLETVRQIIYRKIAAIGTDVKNAL